jgi:hypothetical protein
MDYITSCKRRGSSTDGTSPRLDHGPLPAVSPDDRAVVVQVHAAPPGPSAADDARGEPGVSGQLVRCQSMEELLAAMIHVLADVPAQHVAMPNRHLGSLLL